MTLRSPGWRCRAQHCTNLPPRSSKGVATCRLEGRTAIVTGGAVGIGQHYSQALAAEGAQVMIADIKDGTAVAEEIAAKYGRNSTASMQFDVSDEAQCKALVAKTWSGSARSTSWSTTPRSTRRCRRCRSPRSTSISGTR